MDTSEKHLATTLLYWLLTAQVVTGTSCVRSADTLQRSSNKNSESVVGAETKTTAPNVTDEKMFYDVFVRRDSMSYDGFLIVKYKKTVEAFGVKTNVSYAVLRKRRRTIATFDGVYHSAGNATDFGLCSMLGGQSRQLLVSQTIPRGGRHWVVDLSSNGRVLFDSYDYGLAREEAFLMDVDNDGVKEIGLLLTTFWGFGTMAMAEHEALPMIVFKYNLHSRNYLPANPGLAYGLDGIEQEANAVSPDEKPRDVLASAYLAKRLGILLRYVYAGKRKQGWAFFDKTYQLPDKRAMKAKIRKELTSEPIYAFIYGPHGNARRASHF